MIEPGYPLAAIVGQPDLTLALLLASVDWRLSVLLIGDKGSGKSTAARALADVLPAAAPFVNLPIGVTEDRLLGGLNLSEALRGQASLKRGLIHEAHGGVLYIDEVNLLPDAMTDALLDVASSGRHYVERDGFSSADEARFILLGSMNVEEGALRPQLLDRFALSVEVEAPMEAEDRARIVAARLRFDADSAGFSAEWEAEQRHIRESIVAARKLLANIHPTLENLQEISRAVIEAGVRSLRADLAVLRAAIAHTALAGRAELTREDVERVLPLVLNHRTRRSSGQNPPPPARDPGKEKEGQAQPLERIFPPQMRDAPEVRIRMAGVNSNGRHAAEEMVTGAALDAAGSLARSFRNTGQAALTSGQLVYRKREQESGIRFLFVVDCSGSHAARERMRAVKGAVAGLLQSSVDHKDEAAVISFRGAKAELVLEPCRDVEKALKVLEFLPTGGRTPLAHALELAGSLATPASLLILVTDGRANVPLRGTDGWADALEAARAIDCRSLLVDSSMDSTTAGAIEQLTRAMRARTIRLDELSGEALLQIQ